MLIKPPPLLTMFHGRWHKNYDDGYNNLSKVKEQYHKELKLTKVEN